MRQFEGSGSQRPEVESKYLKKLKVQIDNWYW